MHNGREGDEEYLCSLDLDHLFDWNVKQLFLYLVAEYVTPANVSGRRESANSRERETMFLPRASIK